MSNLSVRGNASGTGTVIVESPNTNTNRTITLPDATTTLVGTDATQTLTNKTISGGSLSGVSGALTQGNAVSSTSGTAIDFTGIPSWAKRITVMFNGVSTNGTSTVQCQVGTASGIVASGYSSQANTFDNTPGGALSTTGFLLLNRVLAATQYSGQFQIVNLSGNIWTTSGVLSSNVVTSGQSIFGGVISLSGVLDRLRITAGGTDTFDAGSINIMWEG